MRLHFCFYITDVCFRHAAAILRPKDSPHSESVIGLNHSVLDRFQKAPHLLLCVHVQFGKSRNGGQEDRCTVEPLLQNGLRRASVP